MGLIIGPDQDEDNKIFGEFLQQCRISKQLSRNAAARTLNVSSEYVRLIERGKRAPSMGLVPHILDLYEMQFRIAGLRTIVIEGHLVVDFISRILEAREPKNQFEAVPSNATRLELIAQITQMLFDADDKTLWQIRKKLVS